MLCVLLKKSLYWGNSLCICFVNFVANNLVFYMVMIDGGSWGFVIKSCKHGIAVLSEAAFQVMAYVSRLVCGIGPGGGKELGIGGGLEYVYLFMGLLYLNDSVMGCLGRYENASCRFCMLSESWFRCI